MSHLKYNFYKFRTSCILSIPKQYSGFTLLELVVAMGIFISLIGISTIGLSNLQQRSTVSSAVDSFLADLKEQQIKAMVGDSEGRGITDDYGVHFDTTSYTLFHGTYILGDSSNFVVSLPSTTQITASFPSSQVLFLKGGGEATGGCSNPLNCQITINSTNSNTQKTLKMNIYGIIYQIVSVP